MFQFQSQVAPQSWTTIMHLASLKEQIKGRKQKQLLSSSDSLKQNPTGWTAREQVFWATFLFWCISTSSLDVNLYYPCSSHKIPLFWGKIFSEQSSLLLPSVGILQASGEFWVTAISEKSSKITFTSLQNGNVFYGQHMDYGVNSKLCMPE